MDGTKLKLAVYGMKCHKCVARVTGLIDAFESVEQVLVSLEDKSAEIDFKAGTDPQLDTIKEALHEAGFQTSAPESEDDQTVNQTEQSAALQTESLRFNIQGMSCASCAATIEKRLRGTEGIATVAVNLAGNFGQVEFDPAILSEQDIFAAVDVAGYKALPTDQDTGSDQEAKHELYRLWIAVGCAVPIMLLMFLPLFGTATLWVNALLATIAQFTAGLGFYLSAWKSLKSRSANMDVLVSLGITAAYGYSVLAVFGLLGENATVFFETSAMLIMFIRFGKWLEARAKGRAGAALKQLLQLQADHAVLLENGQEQEVPASKVKPGDLLLVRPGGKIPVDGEVVEGVAAVDEAMISGESVPVDKGAGSQVENVAIQRISDRVSNYFVPTVVLVSLLTFVIWFLLVDSGFLFAFQMAIAVMVIACPCALGLATPTAIMVGSSVGLERGILFKKASVLEQISKLQILLLDKTGTLTTGEFQVAEIATFNSCDETQLLQLAASLEESSQHPLAKSIVTEARQRNLQWETAKSVEEIGGQGVRSVVEQQTVLCGQQKLLENADIDMSIAESLISRLAEAGNSLVFLAREDQLLGIIALSDVIKPNTQQVVSQLHDLGLKTVLLTGDRRVAAQAVAKEIGIEQVEAEVHPEQKLDVVRKYQQQGLMVGMVGDGINDAPALAQADIGIAIGSGSDVAKETGDLILVGGDLFDIERGIRLGRKTLLKIKQNLFWAFFYNVLGIPLAAGLFYTTLGLYLKPEFAGLAMAFSSVSVVGNSLLLRRMKAHLEDIGQ